MSSGTILLHTDTSQAEISLLGGTLCTFAVIRNGVLHHVLYGHNHQPVIPSAGQVNFPFTGRLANNTFHFENREYTLRNTQLTPEGHGLHGFAFLEPWKLISSTASSASIRFSITPVIAEKYGFPFLLSLTLSYELSEQELQCTYTVENHGHTNAPWSLGFHPYFTFGNEPVDALQLTMSAATQVSYDGEPHLIPNTHSFNEKTQLSKLALDTCFTDLKYRDSIAETSLHAPNGEETIIWQDTSLPYVQLFSADPFEGTHHRAALAIEPQTSAGFAHNAPELGLCTLKPQERAVGSWGIRSVCA
jgi:aldose 1-epimerase